MNENERLFFTGVPPSAEVLYEGRRQFGDFVNDHLVDPREGFIAYTGTDWKEQTYKIKGNSTWLSADYVEFYRAEATDSADYGALEYAVMLLGRDSHDLAFRFQIRVFDDHASYQFAGSRLESDSDGIAVYKTLAALKNLEQQQALRLDDSI